MIIHTGVFVSKQTKETTSVNFELSKECNALLNSTKKRTGRSKKSEASARLHDHLTRFPTETWEEKK